MEEEYKKLVKKYQLKSVFEGFEEELEKKEKEKKEVLRIIVLCLCLSLMTPYFFHLLLD